MSNTAIAVLFMLTVSAASAQKTQPIPPLKITFGEKEKGKANSPERGTIQASGKCEIDPVYVNTVVEVLIRDKGMTNYAIHKAKIEKGQWEFMKKDLPAGIYQVRFRVSAKHGVSGADVSHELPDILDRPAYIEVVVK